MSAPHLPELGVIVVAAGRGERLGADRPKAFIELGGASPLEHAVRTVVSLSYPGQLVLVVPEGFAREALEIAAVAERADWQISVVRGGRERHESVRLGLDALADSVETVLVHDAARPLAPLDLFERVIAAVHEFGCGVVPVQPVADSLKSVDAAAGVVLGTVDRHSLVAAQTPQGFPREVLIAAHQTAQLHAPNTGHDLPGDDSEVVQRAGGTVRTVFGSGRAHKLTTVADLQMLEGLLGA